jgi:signal transduction histidine kinase
MEKQVETLSYLLRSEPQKSGKPKLVLDLPQPLDDIYSEHYGRYFYAVLADDGRVLISSLPAGGGIFPLDRTRGHGRVSTTRGFVDVEGVSQRIERDDGIYYFQLGENLAHQDVFFDDFMTAFSKIVLWIVLPLMLLVFGFDIFVFRAALEPIREASREAETISGRNLSARISHERLPTEMIPLVKAANNAFERLEEAYRSQQHFNSDAAHEMRTPLAILRAQVENTSDTALREQLLPTIDHLAHILSQLLQLSETETTAIAFEDLDLHRVALEVVEYMAPLIIDQNRMIELAGVSGPVMVRGQYELLFRALRNLIENATRHTPEGGCVVVSVEADGSVSIADEGEGVPPEARELIFERFWRGDRNAAGRSGIGLAIVKKIVELHGARIEVGDRQPHGAVFSLHFPLKGEA